MDLRRLLPAASAPVLALALSACGATWTPVDGGDGDGVSIAEGDCDESPTTGASIGPDQAEIHYDGVDQNCNGNDDENDKDGDGIASTEFGGTDCWDDPDIVPDAFVALNGLPQLAAADVYPGAAADTFYDGIDQDCAGDSDFDKDGDGFDAGRWPQRDGSLGSDCWDADDEDAPSVATCGADGTAGLLTAADVNPEATESSPLDGIDQDCSADLSIVEFDVDGDSFPFCEECDDANAMIYPNPAIPEVWYNGIDENCDLNDGDQDGDGYVDAAYTEPGAAFYRVDPANASASALDPDGDGTDNFQAGDCWDTPESRPTVYTAINGLPQPAAAEVNPGVQEDTPYDDVDQDCAGDSDFDADGDGQDTRDYLTRAFAQGPDCDDSDAIVFEGSLAEMWYDGVDTDCEGNDDYDQDRDRHVPDAYVGLVTTYAAGTGSLPGGDCDDQNDHANPAEPNELCATDFDDDCDGSTNDVNAEGAQRFYADADRDGYGDPAESRLTCIAEDIYDVPYFATEELYTDTVPVPDAVDTDPVSNRAWDVGEPYVDANGNGRIDLFDCDDTGPVAADRFPGNPEVVGDGIDQDCNIARDEDTSGTLDPSEQANVDDCFVDRDNDGFGTAVVRRGLSLDCTEDDRLAKVDGDCRDVGTNARYAYPGAAPQDSAVDCMMDRDGDLWGDRVAPVSFLETGFEAVEGTDCDDADAGDFPGATEIAANGDDEDCDVSRNTADTNGDGLPDGTDLCFVDTDNDGFGTNATVAGSTLDCTADLGVASARWIGAEAYVDANGNHRWDDGEPYTDADGSGAYEFGEPFEDLDFNGERNPAEDFTDTDANGTWTFGTPVVDCLDRTSVHPDAARTFPGAAEAEDAVACKMDADGDGFGDDDLGKPSRDTAAATGALARLTLTPGTTLVAGTDCDDSSAQDKPQAATAELVGNLDDEDCTDTEICYVNIDRDAFRVGPAGSQLVPAVSGVLRTDSADMDCDDAGEAPAFYVAGVAARSASGATPGGAVDRNRDCIDDPAVHAQAAHAYPGAAELDTPDLALDANPDTVPCMMDADEDGYGDDDGLGSTVPGRAWRDDGLSANVLGALRPVLDVDVTEGTHVSFGHDCDDSSDQDHPGADEVVGNLDDEDCDDVPGEICYVDEDGDGYRTGPDGARYRLEVDAMVNAAGLLTVVSADMDCGDVGEAPAFYVDGSAARSVDGDTPPGADSVNGDCLDHVTFVYDGTGHPDAVFAYPGAAPNDDGVACMMDADGDGFGDDDGGQAARDGYADAAFEGAGVLAAIEATPQTDATPDTTLVMGSDCDDSSAQDKPGAAEIVSNGDDEDCDTKDDCLADGDNDNYAPSGAAQEPSEGIATLDATLCFTEDGHAPSQASPDCDDADIHDYPGATETVGNLDDENCDGTEICYVDADNDGYRVGPAGAQLTSAVTASLRVASGDMDCSDSGEAAASVSNGDCVDSTGVHAQAARMFPRAVGGTYGGVSWQDGAGCLMDADQDGYADDDRRMASRDTSTAIVLANLVPTEGTTIGTGGSDCDDSSASDHPDADEIVGNEDDDDCTNETEYCYVNADGDNYRVGPTYTVGQDAAHLWSAVAEDLRVLSADKSCSAAGEAPRTLANGDCIDSTAVHANANKAFPGAAPNETGGATACMMDVDGDDWGDDDLGASARDTAAVAGALRALTPTSGTTFTVGTDCDDSSSTDKPGGTETVSNGDDEDCDTKDDCLVDNDNDNYAASGAAREDSVGVAALDATLCATDANRAPSQASPDCDDSDAGDYPNATELVGNLDDEDCNGTEICYVNADNDSHRVGPSGAQLTSAVAEAFRVASTDMDCTDSGEAAASVSNGDCIDSTAVHANADKAFPGAAPNETGGSTACMMDADGDDWGDDDQRRAARDTSTTVVLTGASATVTPTSGTTITAGTDCDDSSASDKPGGTETVSNGDDEDCDTKDDCLVDSDDDNYAASGAARVDSVGIAALNASLCATESNRAPSQASPDCDDADSADYPSATETVGNLDDENCDGTEICYVDADNDGYRVGPAGAQLTSAVTASLRVASGDMDCSDSGEAAASVSNGDCVDSTAVHAQAARMFPRAVGGTYGGVSWQDVAVGCLMDADQDGYADDDRRMASRDTSTAVVLANLVPTEGTTIGTGGSDCDDSSASDHPDADEIVGNEDDDDCTNETEYCYRNDDGDSHRVGPTYTVGQDAAHLVTAVASGLRVLSADKTCSAAGEAPRTLANGDCIDSTAVHANANKAFPGAAPNETGGATACMMDVDGDDWGDDDLGASARDTAAVAGALRALTPTSGTTFTVGTDCDDSSSTDKPGGTETVSNGDDEDCDTKDDCLVDNDNDNYAASGAARADSVGVAALDATLCATDANRAPSQASPDCDDSDAGDYPSATELVGNLDDEDCNGSEICYVNADGDAYRVGPSGAQLTSAVAEALRVASTDMDCTDSGEAAASVTEGDCLDSGANAASAFPGAAPNETGGSTACMMDVDGDDYGDDTVAATVSAGTDCDDAASTTRPGAVDTPADGINQDCSLGDVCYVDADSDSYGSSATVSSTDLDCADQDYSGSTDEADDNLDCNDTNGGVNPGVSEITGDGVDQNCNGAETCYADADQDTYRHASTTVTSSTDTDCSDPGEALTSASVDCDDANASIKPGVSEITGDGVDQNCDGAETCYADADGDAYRHTSNAAASLDADCTDAGEALTSTPVDCNDSDATFNPGVSEITGDEVDQNCDGAETCYADGDQDTFRHTSNTVASSTDTDCSDAGEALTWASVDCDDTNFAIKPGATELCDGVDNNCASGTSDEAGLVTKTAGASVTNVASTFTNAASPVAITPANGDSYAFCGGSGSHYVRFTVNNGVATTITGRASAVLNAGTSGGGGPIIDVAAGGQVTVAGQSTSDMLGLTGGAGKLVSTARLGGAIYADASAAPTNPTVALTHVSVFGNSAADDAGAMYLAGVASATLTTSQVHANTSAGGVGGVFVEAGGALTCTGAAGTSTLLGIYDNTGLTDGGVYLERGGPSDASFTANTCDFGTILGGNTNKFGAGPTYTNQDVFAENGGSGTGYHFNANDRTVSCTNGACTPFP